MPTTTQTWLDVMPELPLARGVPVVSTLSGATAIVVHADENGAILATDILNHFVLYVQNWRVDLDDPQGVAYALRWIVQNGWGDGPIIQLYERLERVWAHHSIEDYDRLDLARACAEVDRNH